MRKLAVVLVLAVALGAAGTAVGLGAARGAFGGCGFPERSDCLRILFIGNSYTAVNDLPGTFARLARSAGLAVDASSIAPGGQTLAGHAADPDVRNAIAGTAWTAVVLQEQSEIPAVAQSRDASMAPAAATLVAAVWADRATPVLYETWAHRDGWPDARLDRAAMQAAIDQAYEQIGASLGATVAPVGRAWQRVGRGALDRALAGRRVASDDGRDLPGGGRAAADHHRPDAARAGGDRWAAGGRRRDAPAGRRRDDPVGSAS